MDVRDILRELFGRVPGVVRQAVQGLDADQLRARPEPAANSIGWLVWHLTRIEDDHVADVLGEPQLWVTGDWPGRFGLDADPSNTGYDHDPDDVAAVRPENADVLVAYHAAVAERTRAFLEGLGAPDLDRVVDEAWDPPVTLGVRLISVASDSLQHAGQANYLRGLIERDVQLRA
jgi:uncharacterized damage-inducible protein DinB